MSLRPCPNPACRSEDVCEPGDHGSNCACRLCGVCGPYDDPCGAKWNALPRIGDNNSIPMPPMVRVHDLVLPLHPTPLTHEQRADMVIRLVEHWRKRLTSRTRYDRDNVTHWTGQDDEQLRRAIREMETWEAVWEKRDANG